MEVCNRMYEYEYITVVTVSNFLVTGTGACTELACVHCAESTSELVATWVTWNSTGGSAALYYPSPPFTRERSKHSGRSDDARSALSPTGHSDSHFHQTGLPRQMAYGSEVRAIDGGSEARVYYIHRVTLSPLAADTEYSELVFLKIQCFSLYE